MAFQINSKKIAKNTITLYTRYIITMLISFFTVRVTLEQLGVENYGLNNLVGSIVSMFSFINGSMGTAVQRFYSYEIGKENEGRLSKVFGVGLFLHIMVALITFVACEVFAILFLQKMNIPAERMFAAQVVFQINIVILCMGIVTVPYTALLFAREQFSKTAIIEVTQSIFKLGNLFLLIIISFDKLIVLAVLNLLVSTAAILSYVFLGRRYKETHSKPLYDKDLVKEMLKFVSMLLVTVFASLLNTQGVVMLINLFFGLTINAAYAVAVQVQNAVNTFVTNFKSSMVPQIMASYGAGDLKSMHNLINFGTKLTFIMLLMITMPLISAIQWILTIWLKTPPEYASQLVVLILISINISSYTYFLYQGVHASGKIMKQQTWTSASYLLSILFIYIAFKFGLNFYTAIFINMAVGVFQSIINIIYAKKCYNYSIGNFIQRIFMPSLVIVALVIIMVMGLIRFVDSEVLRLAISFVLDLSVLPLAGLIILFSKKERQKVLELFNKLLSKRA